MTIEQSNLNVVTRFIEDGLNSRNLAILDDVARDDYTLTVAGFGVYRGLTDVHRFYETTVGGFPDLHVHIEKAFAVENDVVITYRSEGTNTGSALGMPPTGRSARWSGTTTYRLEKGRLTEATTIEDMLGVLIQLGVVTLPRH